MLFFRGIVPISCSDLVRLHYPFRFVIRYIILFECRHFAFDQFSEGISMIHLPGIICQRRSSLSLFSIPIHRQLSIVLRGECWEFPFSIVCPIDNTKSESVSQMTKTTTSNSSRRPTTIAMIIFVEVIRSSGPVSPTPSLSSNPLSKHTFLRQSMTNDQWTTESNGAGKSQRILLLDSVYKVRWTVKSDEHTIGSFCSSRAFKEPSSVQNRIFVSNTEIWNPPGCIECIGPQNVSIFNNRWSLPCTCASKLNQLKHIQLESMATLKRFCQLRTIWDRLQSSQNWQFRDFRQNIRHWIVSFACATQKRRRDVKILEYSIVRPFSKNIERLSVITRSADKTVPIWSDRAEVRIGMPVRKPVQGRHNEMITKFG